MAEHSPWVARHAAIARPFASRDAMIQAFTDAVQGASREAQLALLRAHPDLGTRAGLTRRFLARAGRRRAWRSRRRMNCPVSIISTARYKAKFDFPFILAVRGATRQQILAGISERIDNSAEDEFATALGEVCRIFRFRIEDRVEP